MSSIGHSPHLQNFNFVPQANACAGLHPIQLGWADHVGGPSFLSIIVMFPIIFHHSPLAAYPNDGWDVLFLPFVQSLVLLPGPSLFSSMMLMAARRGLPGMICLQVFLFLLAQGQFFWSCDGCLGCFILFLRLWSKQSWTMETADVSFLIQPYLVVCEWLAVFQGCCLWRFNIFLGSFFFFFLQKPDFTWSPNILPFWMLFVCSF